MAITGEKRTMKPWICPRRVEKPEGGVTMKRQTLGVGLEQGVKRSGRQMSVGVIQ